MKRHVQVQAVSSEVATEMVCTDPSHLLARIRGPYVDYLLHNSDADEQSRGRQQPTQRSASHGLIDKVAHDLGIQNLEADPGQEQGSSDDHQHPLRTRVFRQQPCVLSEGDLSLGSHHGVCRHVSSTARVRRRQFDWLGRVLVNKQEEPPTWGGSKNSSNLMKCLGPPQRHRLISAGRHKVNGIQVCREDCHWSYSKSWINSARDIVTHIGSASKALYSFAAAAAMVTFTHPQGSVRVQRARHNGNPVGFCQKPELESTAVVRLPPSPLFGSNNPSSPGFSLLEWSGGIGCLTSAGGATRMPP